MVNKKTVALMYRDYTEMFQRKPEFVHSHKQRRLVLIKSDIS